MKKLRKIACITGTRADYPRVKSVLYEIEKRPDLSLQLIVTGSHLLEEYGMSKNEIISDGTKSFKYAKTYGTQSPQEFIINFHHIMQQ